MKQLVVLNNPRAAQAFIDYLATLNVPCVLADDAHGVAILLENEQQLALAEKELAIFLQDSNHPRYHAASWQSGKTTAPAFRYVSEHSFMQMLRAHAGPLTFAMLLLCAAIFVLMSVGFRPYIFSLLRMSDTLPALLSLDVYRAFTPVLLHFSLLHIVFNCLWWWQLGGEIEQRLGSMKLLLITLVAAIIPNVAQFLATGPNFGGLSGVVYALLGYVWFTGWLRPHKGLQLNPSIVVFMLIWLVIGFMNVVGPATANLAHLFGLFVGCMQAVFDRLTDKYTS